MPQLMIKVCASLAAQLSSSEEAAPGELVQLVERAGGKIGSPTGSSGEASQYFPIENVSSENVERLRSRLERLPGVEAAYLKPTDALP